MKKLSHYDSAGSARMVDVSAKRETVRTARAQAFVRIRPAVLKQLPRNPKGNPLEIARIAGIAAAKKTSELIPLCHPLMLSHADVDVSVVPCDRDTLSYMLPLGVMSTSHGLYWIAQWSGWDHETYDILEIGERSIAPVLTVSGGSC